MVVILNHEATYFSIYAFLEDKNHDDWFRARHPEYDGEDPFNVDGFDSDKEEIEDYYVEQKGVYNVWFDEDSDCIVVDRLYQIYGKSKHMLEADVINVVESEGKENE